MFWHSFKLVATEQYGTVMYSDINVLAQLVPTVQYCNVQVRPGPLSCTKVTCTSILNVADVPVHCSTVLYVPYSCD